MINELAVISAEPNRLVRLFLTPEHRAAADLVARWMKAVGLEVSEDALGTLRGRWRGRHEMDENDRARRLLIGSHLDTVIDAGKYDGPLGIIAGLLAIEHFARACRRFPFGIDVLAFGDEEGSRFPTSLSTSAATAGVFDLDTLALCDHAGVSYVHALRAYGKDPAQIPTAAYPPGEAAAYVEVHIEQGPALEAVSEPLGVVTGIVGRKPMRIAIDGRAGHAGTVPMDMRRDALAGAAEMILAIEAIARQRVNAGLVGTVGWLEASPGAPNVIPGRVAFTLDLRAMDDRVRRDALDQIQAAAWRAAEMRGLTVTLEPLAGAESVQCAPELQDALAAAVSDLGHNPIRIASGAGHDAQMMARLCPSAMLFVRCREGISHNPAEYAAPADMGAAVAALIGFIEWFDRRALY